MKLAFFFLFLGGIVVEESNCVFVFSTKFSINFKKRNEYQKEMNVGEISTNIFGSGNLENDISRYIMHKNVYPIACE